MALLRRLGYWPGRRHEERPGVVQQGRFPALIDLSRILAGPSCTLLLAELGARVIRSASFKVEPAGQGDDARQNGLIRNDEALALDLNRRLQARVTSTRER